MADSAMSSTEDEGLASRFIVLNLKPSAPTRRTAISARPGNVQSVNRPLPPRIEVICGPMFAGKSEELKRRVNRMRIGGYEVFVVKSVRDKRSDDDLITTHAGSILKADVILTKLADLGCVLDNLKAKPESTPISVIAIDEAQFFDDVDTEVVALADAGYIVITSGCETDFNRKPFKNYHNLFVHAEKIDKLSAVCHYCKGDANYTYCTDSTKLNSSGILVGGSEIYEAVCRVCYNKRDAIKMATNAMAKSVASADDLPPLEQ